MAALQSARARLLEIDPTIADDDTLMLDSIEGEAEGDPLAIIDRLVAAAIHAADLAEIAHVRATELAERKARFKRRNEQLRDVVFQMVSALELKKIERPEYTASVRAGQQRVIVTDEMKLPDSLIRITRTPALSLIAAGLKAGEVIEGAELANGTPSLAIHTR
jgi:hypothetical protein